MSLPRYPEYKASGVAWLGEIPSSWTVQPLKYSTHIYTGNSLNDAEKKLYESTDPDCLPYISSKDIDFATHEVQYENGLRISKEQDELKIAYRGSFLLCIEGGSAGKKVAMLSHDVCFVNKLCCFSSGENSKFKYYFTQTQNFKDKFELSMTGLIGGVSTSLLKNFSIPTPSSHEQTAIANFLDRETGKIDALIAEQQRLVELLAEKRQAVISQAVTKGLNHNAKMKDSGIEWLGEVPEHWEVFRLGTLFREVADEGQTDRPILSVSIHDGVSDRELDDEEMDRKVTRSEDRGKYKSVEPGDLVYNMMRAWQGGFGTVEVAGMVSPAYVVARPRFTFSTEFIEQQLRSPQAIEEMRRHSRGVTDFRLRLYWDEFKAISVVMAPCEEQNSIAAFLGTETAKFDTLTAEANRSIELLQERRSALISAAVTGKIDVRTFVERKPV